MSFAEHDTDTLDLRRMVAAEPVASARPDLAGAIIAGRRSQRRRSLGRAAMVMGVAALLVGPIVGVAGYVGSGDQRRDDVGAAQEPPAHPSAAPDCGPLSCVGPDQTPETETILQELVVGSLAGGGDDLLYVFRAPGETSGAMSDVIGTGHRQGSDVIRTARAVDVEAGNPEAPRFWFQEGHVNGHAPGADQFVVVGYVDGLPESITWSTPDGREGTVEHLLRRDGYTAFAVAAPTPAGYQPPQRVKRNDDGTFSVETKDGTVTAADEAELRTHLAQRSNISLELTITTSDGWSCDLATCGSSG